MNARVPDVPRLTGVLLADDPASWSAAGFVVDDGCVQVGPVTVVLGSASATPQLAFDRAHPTGAAHLDGVLWTVRPASTAVAPAHPNGIDGFDHLVITAPSLERVREAVTGAGFEIRRERATRIAGTDATQLFAFAGGVLLEIAAMTAPSEVAAVGAEPATVWGISLTAPDIDATAAWFGDDCGPVNQAVQPGRRIATVRHRNLGLSMSLALMTARRRGPTGDQQ